MSNSLFPRFSDAEYARRYGALQLGAAVVVKSNGGEALHNYPFKFPICG